MHAPQNPTSALPAYGSWSPSHSPDTLATGTLVLPPTTIVAKDYGCWQDSDNNERIMLPHTKTTVSNIGACAQSAAQAGKRIFGTQNGNECWIPTAEPCHITPLTRHDMTGTDHRKHHGPGSPSLRCPAHGAAAVRSLDPAIPWVVPGRCICTN